MAALMFTPLFISALSLFLLLLGSVSYLITKNIHRQPSARPQLPLGPKQWPVVGSIVTMLLNKPVFRWVHQLMHELNLEIMCLRFCGVHVIFVTSPEIAREFLKTQDANFLSRPFCVSAFITSGGYSTAALSPLGDQWKKMRRILATDVLSTARHRWLESKRAQEANHMIRFIFNMCGFAGGVVNVRVISQHYCGNVIRRMVFNKRFFGDGTVNGGPGAEEIEHVAALFTTLTFLYAFSYTDYMPLLRVVILSLRKISTFLGRFFDFDGHIKIIETANASIRKYQDAEVDERIRQWANGTKTKEEDLLDVLIRLKDDAGNPALTSDEIKSQLVEIMIATVDNPSNAIEWALAEMINQPHLLKRAWDELDEVVGRDRFVQEADLPQLNFIKACAREAFRLHPIAPFNVPHVAIKDTEVSGYFIPKGSHLLLSRPGLGRNARVWEDALLYKPERHLVEGKEVVLTDHDLRMLSFSTGRRGCAGVLLGSTMTAMLLARLLQAFTWEVPPGLDRIDLNESAGDLMMAEPLHAMAKPRLPDHLYSNLLASG